MEAAGDGANSAREELASFNSQGASDNTSDDPEASFPRYLQQLVSELVKASLLHFNVLLANKIIFTHSFLNTSYVECVLMYASSPVFTFAVQFLGSSNHCRQEYTQPFIKIIHSSRDRAKRMIRARNRATCRAREMTQVKRKKKSYVKMKLIA